jgi:hypothetical protein
MADHRARLRSRLPALALLVAVAGCTIRPTPSMIADCLGSAMFEAYEGPKAASLFIDGDRPGGVCRSCMNVLRERRLDFVEFRDREQDGLVDRVRLLPRGDPRCAPTADHSRQPLAPLPFFLSVPGNSCLAVERHQQPSAEMRLTLRTEAAGDHAMELYDAAPRAGGPVRARVRDFTIRSPDAGAATCSRVVPGFPSDPMGYVLDRIAQRR